MKLEFYHGRNDVGAFNAPDDADTIIIDKASIIRVDRNTPGVITFWIAPYIVPYGTPNVEVALTSINCIGEPTQVATKLENVDHIRINFDGFGKLD